MRPWSMLVLVLLLSTAGHLPESEPTAAPSASGLQATLQRLEYQPAPRNGRLSAPNRAHGFRLVFTERGLSVEEREGGLLVELGLTAFGRPGAQRTMGHAPAHVSGDGKVERRWAGLAEWFLNQPEGLEHGWTIDEKASGEGPLVLSVAVSGARALASGREAVFESERGRVLHYGDLKALDADGTRLPAQLTTTPDGLRIEVNDTAARYPIVIDPLLTASAWTGESNQAGAQLGSSVASAGDVNADGYADVIVGAAAFDNGELDEGRAFLFLGSASGLSSMPAWTAEGDQANAAFGASVASAGDVNGDGFSDVVVGADRFDNGQTDEGRAFLFLGSANGLSLTPAWTAESNQSSSTFGHSVASAGDVNGDGFSDVVVGAFGFDNGQMDEGRAFLYLGSASGLTMTPVWTAESNQASAAFGSSVASAGDVNGDGFSDVVIGAPSFANGQAFEGRAFVYLGGTPTGLSLMPAWTAESNQVDAQLGRSVASAGDVNGDGYSDVVVSAYSFDNGEMNEGRAFLYLGSAGGLNLAPSWAAESNQASAFYGQSVASAGDVNGDGFSDVVVGAASFTNGQLLEGRAFLYLGTATGLSLTPGWTAESDQANSSFGYSVASAGDVNGDGFSDVVVGAYDFSNGQGNEGRAFGYLGSANGLAPTAAWTAESNQANGNFGVSIASAGDVNADGYSDVIVGASGFSNGQTQEGQAALFLGNAGGLSASPAWTAEGNVAGANLGASVASAGDVNGDGFSDVIVGASGFANGQLQEGRAALYLGSASGLRAAPSWAVESNQANAFFGDSVASAGDVNGDGFSDVVVGASLFSNPETREGRAFLYLGSASGLSPTAAWTFESDQADARLGSNSSVASAGDVNGDGFSDVVVGAPFFTNGESLEGRVFLFLGSASGLSRTPAWTAESNQAVAFMGGSVASAGDVNRDGYSDVVVGADYFSNGENREGRVFLYLGSPSGLSTNPAWTAESNQVMALFGFRVASAGDVDGDGFSDVLVGANAFSNGESTEGSIFLFRGNASGLGLTPVWTAESNQAGALLGHSVASAGDVNGDGYADVVAGAVAFSSGQSGEGRAFLYLGGDSAPGMPRGLTQQLAGTMPVGPGARGAAPVTLSALGFNALATQQRVTLETEVKAVGVRFDGGALVSSARGLARQRQSVTWSSLGPGRYHWRARVVSGQERGRWVSFGGNSEAEADFVIVAAAVDAGTVDSGTMDAGAVDSGTVDAGPVDAGTADSGTRDAGPPDAGIVDSGTVDAGEADAGIVDSGTVDAGEADAGLVDSGTVDAGAADAGEVDAGTLDAGDTDAGSVDAGLDETVDAGALMPRRAYAVGCGCGSVSGSHALLLSLLALSVSRRRRRATAVRSEHRAAVR